MTAEREALRRLVASVEANRSTAPRSKAETAHYYREHFDALDHARAVLAQPPPPDAAAPMLEGAAARMLAAVMSMTVGGDPGRRGLWPRHDWPVERALELGAATSALEAALQGEREGRGA